MTTDERHEHTGHARTLKEALADAIDDLQALAHRSADGDYQATTLGELLAQGLGHGGGAGGDDDPVVGRMLGQAEGAVGNHDVDVGDAQLGQQRARGEGQRLDDLDRPDLAARAPSSAA